MGSPKKEEREITPPADDVDPEDSPKQKEGIFSSLKNSLKRTKVDRSPEEASPPVQRRRFQMVGVAVPAPPRPHSSYTQLRSRPSAPPSNIDEPRGEPTPPVSSSPSLASFDSAGSDSGQQYEVNRLRLLLNASQEDLQFQRQQFEDRERRHNERFDAERAMYEARIQQLEGNKKGEGSSAFRRG